MEAVEGELLRIPLLVKQPSIEQIVVRLGLCAQPKRNGTEAIPYINHIGILPDT